MSIQLTQFMHAFLTEIRPVPGFVRSDSKTAAGGIFPWAPFVPTMIEMGIDVWQGCMSVNNLPELIKEYGKDLTFMGGIDDGLLPTRENPGMTTVIPGFSLIH